MSLDLDCVSSSTTQSMYPKFSGLTKVLGKISENEECRICQRKTSKFVSVFQDNIGNYYCQKCESYISFLNSRVLYQLSSENEANKALILEIILLQDKHSARQNFVKNNVESEENSEIFQAKNEITEKLQKIENLEMAKELISNKKNSLNILAAQKQQKLETLSEEFQKSESELLNYKRNSGVIFNHYQNLFLERQSLKKVLILQEENHKSQIVQLLSNLEIIKLQISNENLSKPQSEISLEKKITTEKIKELETELQRVRNEIENMQSNKRNFGTSSKNNENPSTLCKCLKL